MNVSGKLRGCWPWAVVGALLGGVANQAAVAEPPQAALNPVSGLRAPPGGWKLEHLAPTMQNLAGRSYENGKRLFQRQHCLECHPQNDFSQEFGPDLTKLDPRFQPLDILRDILEPSRRIADVRFDAWTFETTGGRTVFGMIAQETHLAVRILEKPPAAAAPVVLKTSEIETRKMSLMSLMPQGLVDNLTRDEIADLVAYIAARGDASHAVVTSAPSPAQGEHVAAAADLLASPRFRGPVALAWLTPDRSLLVANRKSGTLSLVDVVAAQAFDEVPIGERLSDLQPLGGGGRFLVLDDRAHEAVLVQASDDERIAVVSRGATSRYPTRAAVAADGETAAIACLWSRTVDVLALTPEAAAATESQRWNIALPRVLRTVPLPFAPQEIVAWPARTENETGRVVVADAFGGGLAVVNTTTGKILRTFTVDGHNIRGLAVDAERGELLVAHERLASALPTTAENVRPGKLLQNILRRIPLAALAEGMNTEASAVGRPETSAGVGTEIILDGEAFGAGDPDAVLPLADGRTLALLSGLGELAVVDAAGAVQERRRVGARPLSLLVDSKGTTAFTADSLDDRISVVDLTQADEAPAIPFGPRPEAWPRDRGERLFYDARLTHGAASCHSCHSDGHTNGLLADTHGDGTYGTPKRILTLLGTSLTDHWAWNGEIRELREQVGRSFEETMHVTLKPEQIDDVTAYLHTLPFPPPGQPATNDPADQKLLEQGRSIFVREGCAQCHVPTLTYTSQAAYDVGLRDERGATKFNPPSLRGVGQSDAFFHDGRASSLREVIRRERHQLAGELEEREAVALERFLRSL